MARTASNLALLALLSVVGAQGFGRFGYSPVPHVDGLLLDSAFIAADSGASDHLIFEHPAGNLHPIATSETEQTIAFGESPFCPQKIRTALTAPGISMYCPKGLRLHLNSVSSPYLTWKEGSVSSGVPTPNLKWIVLSFGSKQPPIIFGFPEAPTSMRVDGRAGDWTLNFGQVAGWVRVGAMLGTRSISANTAYSLGQLADQAEKQSPLYTVLPPRLLGLDLDSDLRSVTATWHYDHPGAIVPTAAVLANLGGYPLSIDSPFERQEFDSEEGPMNVLTGKDLSIRFPIRRVPTGRGVGIGRIQEDPIGTAAPNDIPSVVELALENLIASRSSLSRINGQSTFDEFFNQSEYAKEPWTQQLLPYGISGRGIDLCAAQALLEQSLTNASKSSSEQNALLTSIAWRRDWKTWKLWVDDPVVGRRASALAALASALCPEPERRLDAAMLQAGIAAERGLFIWRSHRFENVKVPTLIEPIYGLRQAIFGLIGPEDRDVEFMQQVLSPIRVYGDAALTAEKDAARLKLSWPVLEAKPSQLSLAAGFPVDILKGANLAHFKVDQAFGLTDVHYIPEFTGDCSIYLTVPTWVKKLPTAIAIPPYSEPYK